MIMDGIEDLFWTLCIGVLNEEQINLDYHYHPSSWNEASHVVKKIMFGSNWIP